MNTMKTFWGLVLIGLGSAFLLDQYGILALDFGLLWPLFLIALGVAVLIGGRWGTAAATSAVSIPLEDSQEANIHIEHGAGTIRISGKAGKGELMAGEFRAMRHSIKRSGSSAQLSLKNSMFEEGWWLFPWNWGGQGLAWDFSLNPDIPLRIKLESGANSNELDLRELQVTELELETGASSTKVILPEKAGHTRFDASFGAASLDVRVPEGVAADIRLESGLGSVNIDESRFPRSGKRYTSPDYANAKNKVDIRIETGVSSVRIY